MEDNKNSFTLFKAIHGEGVIEKNFSTNTNLIFKNIGLNDSQQQAVNAIIQNENICIIHGPPGTGKTTGIFIPNLIERVSCSAIVTEATGGKGQRSARRL